MLYNQKYNDFSDNELIIEYKNTKNNVFVGILLPQVTHPLYSDVFHLPFYTTADTIQDAGECTAPQECGISSPQPLHKCVRHLNAHSFHPALIRDPAGRQLHIRRS